MFKVIKAFCCLLSNYASPFVIASAIVAFFVPVAFGWVHGNVSSIILGVIMLSMGLTISTDDVRNLMKQPLHILLGAVAQYTIMPFVAFGLSKVFGLEPYLAVGIILVGCCPGGVSSNVMSYLCHGDVAFSVGMTTASTILAPVMTPLLVSLLASGATVHIKAFPMFVSIIETVILPVAVGFTLNALLGKNKRFQEFQKLMPAIAVLGLAFVVGGVVNSQGASFFTSGLVIFLAVFLHNGLGYLLGYVVGIFTKMNKAKRRTISIEVGMQNAGMATNLATTTAQFAAMPNAAIIAAVSCVWHSISGTILAGFFAWLDKKADEPNKEKVPVVSKKAASAD